MAFDTEIKLVSVVDEAIDWDRMPNDVFGKYIDNREDFSIVEPYLIAGRVPTFFYLREIRHAKFRWVLRQGSEIDRQCAAFRASLARVENLKSGDGAIIPAPELARDKDGVLVEDELDRFDAETWIEIGDAAFLRSFFRNRTERVYRLPPTLAPLWALQAARRAAPSQALPESSSSNPSSGSPADTAPSKPTTLEQQASASI